MNNVMKKVRWAVAVLLFAFCMSAVYALAIDATTVVMNGDTLTAGYYWKNDGTTSATYIDNWNAHFDTGTSAPTLTLRGVSISTSSTNGAMIEADGDVVLALLGSNTLTYDYLSDSTVMKGVYTSAGNVKIVDQTANGTGSLSIEIKNTATGIAAGIYTQDSLAGVIIDSGTILISLMNNQHAHGIRSGGIYIHGGQTTITNTATDYAFGVYAAEDFDMTGGSVSATVAGSESGSCALMFFDEAYISGGYGVFRNTQSGYGAIWGNPSVGGFRVIGGHMVIASDGTEAILFNVANDPNDYAPKVSGDILVSLSSSGAGKTVWNAAMGLLAGSQSDTSPFRYVEFMGKSLLALLNPQTGDAATPLLWLGLGLLALSGAGTFLLLRRRRA